MHAALNALVSDAKSFKRYNKKETYCKNFNTQGECAEMSFKDVAYASFPKTFSMYVKNGGADEGELTFEIEAKKSAWDCVGCKLAGIMALVLKHIMGGATVMVQISCVAGGC